MTCFSVSGGGLHNHRYSSRHPTHSSHTTSHTKATPLRKHKSSLKGPPSARSRRSRKSTSEGLSSDIEMNPSGDVSLYETSHLSTQTATTSSESTRYIQPVLKDLQTRERLAQGPQSAEGAVKCSPNELQVSLSMCVNHEGGGV